MPSIARRLIAPTIGLLLLHAVPALAAEQTPKPNIIFILADEK